MTIPVSIQYTKRPGVEVRRSGHGELSPEPRRSNRVTSAAHARRRASDARRKVPASNPEPSAGSGMLASSVIPSIEKVVVFRKLRRSSIPSQSLQLDAEIRESYALREASRHYSIIDSSMPRSAIPTGVNNLYGTHI